MAYLASNQVRAVHMSVDLDVLDPTHWPGVSTAVNGGLAASDLTLLVKTLAGMVRVAAMDLVELTPPEDADGATAQAALDVAVAGLCPPAAQAKPPIDHLIPGAA